jgi:hypothetical protein
MIMIKDCKVTLNNQYVTVFDFDGTDVQIPSIHRNADNIKVKFEDGKYLVLPYDYVEPQKVVELVESAPVEKPKPKTRKKKKTTNVDAD